MAQLGDVVAQFGDVVAQCWGCGGSMVVHQAVKPAVLDLNPASLQPAGTCHSLLGSQQGWHDNCRLASEGWRKQKKQKNTKKIIRKEKKSIILSGSPLCMESEVVLGMRSPASFG